MWPWAECFISHSEEEIIGMEDECCEIDLSGHVLQIVYTVLRNMIIILPETYIYLNVKLKCFPLRKWH